LDSGVGRLYLDIGSRDVGVCRNGGDWRWCDVGCGWLKIGSLHWLSQPWLQIGGFCDSSCGARLGVWPNIRGVTRVVA